MPTFFEIKQEKHIHTLRTDTGGEFTGRSFRFWLSENGILLETSAPHTPEQNGVYETANRTIVEGSRCILHANELARANSLCSVWNKANSFNSVMFAPERNGWQVKKYDFDENCFTLNWFDGEMLPKKLDDILLETSNDEEDAGGRLGKRNR